MVIRIFYVIVAIFAVMMVFLTLQEPYFSNLKKENIDIANMQMNGVEDYDINTSGIFAKYTADEWIRYSDKDEFKNFKAYIARDKLDHNISSLKGYYAKPILNLEGNVTYHNSDDVWFFSEEVVYNTDTKIAASNVPFKILQDKSISIGKSIVYDVVKKQTKAKDIHAWIERK